MKTNPITRAQLEEIRHLLSHLHGGITVLERSALDLIRKLESLPSKDAGKTAAPQVSGLPRRPEFLKRAEALYEEGQRLNQGYGLLVIEVDHFKRITDTHGTLTGDEVSGRVARLLERFGSPRCVAGMDAGERFFVAMLGTDAEQVGLAEMIRRGAERLHGPIVNARGEASPNVEWRCTVSVGLATAPKSASPAPLPRLLQVASAALEDAKAKGRNQVRAA